MTNNSLNTKTIFQELSIQLAMNGLSFSLRDTVSGNLLKLKYFSFKKIENEQELLQEIQELIALEKLAESSYDSIQVTAINNTLAFVPNVLFEENNLADYLKFANKLEPTDVLSYDSIDSIDAKIVYKPFTTINNYLFEVFGSFEASHHCEKLLHYFQQESKQSLNIKKCYLYFRENTFDCFILNQNKLLFYNNFTFQNNEDVLYFLLFTFEQYKLKQENNPILISGDLSSSSSLFQLLQKYFKQLSKLPIKQNGLFDALALQKTIPLL